MSHEITILISLFTLGLFGGFSHCMGMCGPFVLTQVNNRLKDIDIKNATHFKKLSGIALLPYHLGRITTYSLIGGASSFLLTNIKNLTGFKFISAIFLIFAAFIFLKTAINFRLPFKFNLIKTPGFLKLKKIKFLIDLLFSKPYKFKGYFLGILLGFIPCGLLYGAIITAASLDNYIIAALGMLVFGIATIPSLFLTAIGGYWLFNKVNLKLFSRIILLINSITLFLMACGLILNKI